MPEDKKAAPTPEDYRTIWLMCDSSGSVDYEKKLKLLDELSGDGALRALIERTGDFSLKSRAFERISDVAYLIDCALERNNMAMTRLEKIGLNREQAASLFPLLEGVCDPYSADSAIKLRAAKLMEQYGDERAAAWLEEYNELRKPKPRSISEELELEMDAAYKRLDNI